MSETAIARGGRDLAARPRENRVQCRAWLEQIDDVLHLVPATAAPHRPYVSRLRRSRTAATVPRAKSVHGIGDTS